MHKSKLLLFSIIILLLTACGGKDKDEVVNIESEIAGIEAEVGAITEIECPLVIAGEVEGETYTCGIYTAPVDYAKSDGDRINLTYMILQATNDNPLSDPIVYLAGGPGQSGIVAAGDTLYGDLRQDRDLIFPAQRGTLFSERLGIEECVGFLSDQIGEKEVEAFAESVSANEQSDASLPYEEFLTQYNKAAGAINERCHEAFTNAGLDPTQFNTANSTNDLVGMLDALGYDSFNLHGTSYGTRLALETVRRHPEADIRSVVLDSPATPSSNRMALLAAATHDMVLRLFDDCAADADCNAAYPDLTERTAVLLDQLAADPLTAGEQTIGADEVITQLSDLTNTRANYVPRMIAELEMGETTTYLALLNGEVGGVSSEGSLTSPTIDALIKQIVATGVTADNPFGGLQNVGDILAGAQEDNPREVMKAIAQEKLADEESLPQILDGIDELTADDIQTLVAMYAAPSPAKIDEDDANRRIEAIAKNNAQFLLAGMVCSEQLAFEDVETAVASRDDLAIPGLGSSGSFLAIEVGNCTNYPMGEIDSTYHEPVDSDIPILILQGEFDTRTPLENGISLSEQLGNGTLVIIPQQGHETWTVGSCAAQIGIGFIQNPEQAPDLSCLEQRQERFSLPDDPLN
jgi:pimeloyl-ACP methyl ester carboxylesterase